MCEKLIGVGTRNGRPARSSPTQLRVKYSWILRRWALIIGLFLGASAWAREIPITILHTCDLHGNILPTANYDGQTNLGGLARCATVIKQIRAERLNHTLLVDAGDTIQGTAVSYLSEGRVMVRLLNLLRYDAWILGNHEFDWGVDQLTACAELAGMPILTANIQPAGAGAARLLARVKPYRIIELAGVRVGIIGLTTPGIPTWSRPPLIAGLKFVDSIETLKTVVPEIRHAGAQVLILVVHQGYRDGGDDHANQIKAIASHFPELDVIIGAHTHRNFPELKVSGVLYTQAEYYGTHLGRVDLVYDTTVGRVTHRESRTLLLDAHVALDPAVLKECGPELAQAGQAMTAVLGEATGELDARSGPKHETAIHNLIFDAIAAAVLQSRKIKVDAIIHGVLDKRVTLPAGPITVGDVWRTVPYENKVGICRLTVAELREILDENAGAYNTAAFRGIWGLHWEFDPKLAADPTIKLTRPDGTPLANEEQLTVAFHSYDLAGGGLRWPKLREIALRPTSQLVETEIQTRQAVVDYVRQQQKITPVTHGWWKAVNETGR